MLVQEVWVLVGDLACMSDYSAQFERVYDVTDAQGHHAKYSRVEPIGKNLLKHLGSRLIHGYTTA